MNGDGKTLNINPKVYTDSVIVSDAMLALKSHIKELSSRKEPVSMIRSSDAKFLDSIHARHLKKGTRSVIKQGYILDNGALLVEQSNQRLKNSDHRFYLAVNTTKNGDNFLSQWKVESIYDFEPFDKGFITDIPLAKGFILRLPDGLSHYLTKVSVAKDFKYIARWQDLWK
ncbi:MAG: hypothetical protein L3J84_14240 [Gammaproteobacteria bacterium]|nr:hypothetical protein [Gammaproteobacteria bacterium]